MAYLESMATDDQQFEFLEKPILTKDKEILVLKNEAATSRNDISELKTVIRSLENKKAKFSDMAQTSAFYFRYKIHKKNEKFSNLISIAVDTR